MSNIKSKQKPQNDLDWKTISTATDGTRIIMRTVPAKNMNDAAKIATRIAEIISNVDRESDVYYNQLSLRSWQVEILLCTGKAGSISKPQQELMDAVDSILG